MNRFNFYSVIVPSFNRCEEIRELIDSFALLRFPANRFELIIADDGSTDGTKELVNKYLGEVEFPLNFYTQKNQGPGSARNMGMEKARGDFFIFIDSDCTVSPQWLSKIDQSLTAENADAFGGPDSFKENFPPLLKAINYSMTSFLTTGGIRGHNKQKLGKFYPRSFNMGLSREVYKKIGGFGSLRHGQDIEYSHRIITSGAKVISIPEAVVFHKRRTSVKKFFKQVFNWGVARINLYKIDPAMLEFVHTLPALATSFLLLLLIGSLFSNAPWSVFRLLLPAGLLILLLSGLHAALKYKNIRLFVLVPVIMPIQILGYGLGFLSAFIARVLLGKETFVGFEKKYYK
jgi:glycosyltransferase involved in cell wall biosynthesis